MVGGKDVCNCLAVRQAARRVTQLYDNHLAPLGLRATQFSVLRQLSDGVRSVGELAADMVMDRTTVARVVRPLERDGFVTVAPGRDGRTRALALTPAGHRKLADARLAWRAAQDSFEAAYGTAPAAALRRDLWAMIDAVDGAS